ncbi:MAG: glycosyltransferase family 2 protein [Patescibacteria group bacterium]
MFTDYQKYRFYEIMPGLSIWLTLVLCLFLSFVKPLWMIYFIIIFDIYWVLKVVNFVFYLIVAWIRYKRIKKVDWKDLIRHELYKKEDKRHFVFLTLYNESWEVVKTGIDSIKEACYDKDKFIIIIAGEERTKEHCEKIYNLIKQEFDKYFFDIVFTLHPANLTDEIPGKGSNLNYSEREIKKYIDKKSWKYEDIIATIFDIDTICHPNYFAYLTYVFVKHPNPTHSSYQPIALYNNNMWDSPAILRIMAFGTTFWTMTSLARQDNLVTFSSHSMSFKTIVEVGYHDKRIVSEDSRIFYQCYLHYNGDYEVTPLYLPVSMDTVRDDKWSVSIKNLYKQQRRWAWGVEHVPYLIWEFRKKENKISIFKKIKWVFVEWEGKWSWCLAALIITILGRLPMWVAGEEIRQSALFFNAPHLLEVLMFLAMSGLFLSAFLSMFLLPKKPLSEPHHKYLIMVLQWALLPFTMIFVSALPALDAVTHLMRGSYLGFNVSQKKRK